MKDSLVSRKNYQIKQIYFGKKTDYLINEIRVNKMFKLKYIMEDFLISEKKKINNNFNNKKNIVHSINNMRGFFPKAYWKKSKKNHNINILTLRDPTLLCLKGTMTCEYGDKCKLKPLCMVYRKISLNITNKYVDYIHAPSQYILDLHKKFGLKPKNELVIPNTTGRNLNNIKIDFNSKIDEILYVGNLNFSKGTKTLLKAFSLLYLKNIKLVFIGKGNEKQENYLKEKSKNLNVEFTGWLDKNKVIERIKNAKIVVLPSEWPEAFGRTLIEALMNGTLVIGSNAGAIPELIQNDDYIFPWGNDVELSKLIKKIMSYDEHTYNSELEKFIPKLKKFSLEEHIKEFKKLYESIYDKELTDK